MSDVIDRQIAESYQQILRNLQISRNIELHTLKTLLTGLDLWRRDYEFLWFNPLDYKDYESLKTAMFKHQDYVKASKVNLDLAIDQLKAYLQVKVTEISEELKVVE